jgi:hypothetical protein
MSASTEGAKSKKHKQPVGKRQAMSEKNNITKSNGSRCRTRLAAASAKVEPRYSNLISGSFLAYSPAAKYYFRRKSVSLIAHEGTFHGISKSPGKLTGAPPFKLHVCRNLQVPWH